LGDSAVAVAQGIGEVTKFQTTVADSRGEALSTFRAEHFSGQGQRFLSVFSVADGVDVTLQLLPAVLALACPLTERRVETRHHPRHRDATLLQLPEQRGGLLHAEAR